MAGVCSAHHSDEPVDGCAPCQSTPAQVLGVSEEEWDRKLAAAEASGTWRCPNDGFEWYGTVEACRICEHPQVNLAA